MFYCRGEVPLASDKEDPFRPWFGKLGELRSLSSSTPILALTATANKTHRIRIQRNLNMKKPDEVIDNPDRPNVKLFSVKFTATTDLEEMLAWLIDMLHQDDVPRTLVFTKM